MDAPVDVFLFDGFRLDRRSGGLFRQDESGSFAPVAIGSRALDVLAVLVAHHGQVVSRVAIIDAVWPDVVVEERNLAVQISALRRVLDHRRTDRSCIQTETGRGYRFVAAVTRIADELLPSPSAATPTSPEIQPADDSAPAPGRERPRRRAIAAIASAAVFAAAVLAVWAWNSVGISPSEAPRPRLSIVVLPFGNLSGDRGDDYLADAITDDLTTDLSRVSGMFVIARQSSYTYQGKTVDIRKVGEELGVRYALEGSVRRLGDELRVNAQLVSTETGAHLWAERFDRPLLDVSAATLADGQDDIIRHIASALNVKMVDVESARSLRERPTNADATDLVLRARSLSNQPPSRERTAEARELYEQALKRDPSSVSAMIGIAGIQINQSQGYLGQWAAADALERAGKLISEARAIEPTSEQVLVGSVRLLEAQHRWEDMIPAAERLIAAFPNRVDGYELLATAKRYTGKPADAVPLYEKSVRLDPRNPILFNRYAFLGFALVQLAHWEEATVWFERSLAADPDAFRPIRSARYRVLAGAYAMSGQPDDAHRAVSEATKLWPFGTVRTNAPENLTNAALRAQVARLMEAQRRAGLRDHAEEDADFGVAVDDKLHEDLAGLTPTTVPGAATIRTAELVPFLAEHKPIVIDPGLYFWGVSLPGAVWLKNAGLGGSMTDSAQEHLNVIMTKLTRGDPTVPIVAVGFNSERFDGRNLALRLVALGYTDVRWYRGGREAWEVHELPEEPSATQDW